MDGEIGVHSEPGQGATFWFTVRLAAIEGEARKPVALRPERVLLVDDHDSVREILACMMRSWGFSVDAVADAPSAWRRLHQSGQDGSHYSLLVLDGSMPGHDGLWLLHQMTLTPHMPRTPALLMVTACDRLALVRAAADGPVLPDAVLSKPVTASHLFDTVLELQQRVSVRLPVEAAAFDSRRQAEPIRGAELLLVEDNPANQEIALAMLGKMGLNVTLANHGREALQLLAARRHDLVLMDLQMPVMDGFEATEAIRATDWGRDLPIIAMTAAAFADDRRRVLDAGMKNDFVSKPVDPQQLLGALLRWLPQRQAPVAEPLQPAVLPASPTPALPARLEGFELAQTLERLGQDQSLLLLVMRQFLHDFEPDAWASEFDAACREVQPLTAQRLAHTLKGVAANLGAMRLQAAAAALEEALKAQSGDPVRLQRCRDDCLAALRAATTVLQSGLPAPDAEVQADALQPVQLAQALQDLAEARQLLVRNRLLPVPLLARLREHLGTHAVARQLETLRAQLGVFDFDSALQTLQAMQYSLSS